MHLAILTYGTRGDVQPYVALALGLLAQGYEPTLVAFGNYENLVRGYGVPYAPLTGDVEAVLSSPEGQEYLRSGNVNKLLKNLGKLDHERRHDIRRELLSACESADAIIADASLGYRALSLSEKLELPLILVSLQPYSTPTGDFAHPLVTTHMLPKTLNRLSYAAFRRIYWNSIREDVLEWRAELGLHTDAKSFRRTLFDGQRMLHAYSRHIVPKPRDWDEKHLVTGFLHVPTLPSATVDSRLDELRRWLLEGEAPVFLGFGSMPLADTTELVGIAERLARKLSTRVILGAGWSKFEPSTVGASPELFFLESVDHGWLFPQCRSVVHHGGAGTLATGLRAGIPTVVCSMFADQPFWGERVRKLGIGEHLPFKSLNQERLNHAVALSLRESVRERAQSLGQKLRAEKGVEVAVTAVSSFLQRPQVLQA